MDQYSRGELVFDVIDDGPADGPVVILLHGFPQLNTSWDGVIPKLTARGYRCLAPNQRGYSRGARPTRRRDYRMSELVGDVRALIDASGAQRVHLVGHDFGALVTWFAAAQMPDRLATATALSTPHPMRWPQGARIESAGFRVLVCVRLPAASHPRAGFCGQPWHCDRPVEIPSGARADTRVRRARRSGDGRTGRVHGRRQLVPGDAAE